MAKPRFFISSTYYDLKSIRSELEAFLSNLGYEPVLNEKGHISYGSKEKLEEYCYKEIQLCDILISVIGGRYGSKSSHEDDTVSQHELRTALSLGKQVFIFIDKSVKAEHKFYQANKDNPSTKYTWVENKKVFEILDFVDSLPLNNATFGFDTGQEILFYLKEQLAGLFKNLLIESSKANEVVLIRDLKENIDTLRQLVTLISKNNTPKQDAVHEVLTLQHPAFSKLKTVLKIQHRVVFLTISELKSLVGAYGYKFQETAPWDADSDELEFLRLMPDQSTNKLVVKVTVFENDQLKMVDPSEWDESQIFVIKLPASKNEDDIPF